MNDLILFFIIDYTLNEINFFSRYRVIKLNSDTRNITILLCRKDHNYGKN